MKASPDKSRAYEKIQWVLDNADVGFFIITAPPYQQAKIAAMYRSSRVATLDYSQVSGKLEYYDLSKLVDDNPNCDVMFILNMQIALREKTSMAHFNMSRDNLARKRRIWFFFMDKETEDRLAKHAIDVYSYVRMKVHFAAEEDGELVEQGMLELEDRKNVAEIRKTLARYKEMEERYMALPLEGMPEGQLLAVTVTLGDIATLYRDCADYDNALRLLSRILEIREKILGLKHPDTAEAYNNIGHVCFRQGDYSSALELYEKALKIREKVLGLEHPDVAKAYSDIAAVYFRLCEFSCALEWQEKALAIREKVLGVTHPDTASSYNNIATICFRQGNHPKAMELYEKALNIRKEVLGAEHPDTASTYNNIAYVCSRQGDYSKALKLYEIPLNIREKILGPEHPDTALTYHNIAAAYFWQGDYTNALKWYTKALVVREKVLGSEHTDTASTNNNIAIVYSNMGDYSKALELHEKSYKALLKKLGDGHLSTKQVLTSMQSTYNAIPQAQPFEAWLASRMGE